MAELIKEGTCPSVGPKVLYYDKNLGKIHVRDVDPSRDKRSTRTRSHRLSKSALSFVYAIPYQEFTNWREWMDNCAYDEEMKWQFGFSSLPSIFHRITVMLQEVIDGFGCASLRDALLKKNLIFILRLALELLWCRGWRVARDTKFYVIYVTSRHGNFRKITPAKFTKEAQLYILQTLKLWNIALTELAKLKIVRLQMSIDTLWLNDAIQRLENGLDENDYVFVPVDREDDPMNVESEEDEDDDNGAEDFASYLHRQQLREERVWDAMEQEYLNQGTDDEDQNVPSDEDSMVVDLEQEEEEIQEEDDIVLVDIEGEDNEESE